jgi:hypothetical protein
MVSSAVGILGALFGALAWMRKRIEKWVKSLADDHQANIKEQVTSALHEALPNSPILAGTWNATQQLYTNGGSTLADKVNKSVMLGEKAVAIGQSNSRQMSAMSNELSATNRKLDGVEVKLAELNGQFVEHVRQR